MSREKKWVTASDVARLAGVSRSAVSRAFTPGASVAPETRRKVEEAARTLGYQVNILARSINKGRSNFVGLVTAGFDNAFRNQLIGPLTHQLARQGLIPLLVNTEDSCQQAPGLRDLMSYHVAGIIMTSGAPPLSLAREYVARSIPVVIINRDTNLPGTDVVYSDNVDGARQAAHWLQQRGCRRPAFVGEQPANFSTQQRREAFWQALPGVTCIDVNGSDYHAGFAAGEQLLNLPDIDGVFCATDTLALGLRDALNLPELPLKESLGISHGFSGGFGAGMEYKRAAREAGVAAWRHGGHNELKYHLKQKFRLSPLLDASPEMGWSRKANARKYKPQLKFNYRYAAHQKLSLMYRYEIKRSTGKPRKHTQIWQLMNGYKIARVTLNYGIKYKKSNQPLYRSHREDAEGKLQISYRLTESLAPFVEFKNTAVSSSSAHRQTMLKAGFVWRML